MMIDLTLIAGRRPDLLRRTLASFRDRCFVHGEFARGYASLIDPARDPETQNRMNGPNPALSAYLQQYGCALLSSHRKQEKSVILDIGADWRERRGIRKEVRDGFSTWHHPPEAASPEAEQ